MALRSHNYLPYPTKLPLIIDGALNQTPVVAVYHGLFVSLISAANSAMIISERRCV